ncbi:MAG: DegT/DnrJ/EryC1/StrS family aminotransferase [Desulfobacterales bacterium]|nr:DegT/DnrJ/EryC1/StrS family aminotransferase [Desulfobacterales bacterium]
MKVPFALPELGDEEIEEVAAVIKSGWLTTASRCAQFEKDFASTDYADYTDSKNEKEIGTEVC